MNAAYPGNELDLFAHAHNWKAYWSAQVRPYLGAEVLEVGAGIGSNTNLLRGGATGRWICLEPDPALAARIPAFSAGSAPARTVEVVTGRLADLSPGEAFDSVLYIDVLEHIEDDAAELARAAAHTRPGGRIVVLAPAHPRLYSDFDRAVGHFRRYTKRTLAAVAPRDAVALRFDYLDAAGALASLANRLILRRAEPNLAQIRAWDRGLVPISRAIDPLMGHRLGKSILAVWEVGRGAAPARG